MEFEFKEATGTKWIKFSLMDQLKIFAKICCLVNSTQNLSSTTMLRNDQIRFDMRLETVRPHTAARTFHIFHKRFSQIKSGHTLRCTAQDVSLRVNFNKSGWTPFPKIANYVF